MPLIITDKQTDILAEISDPQKLIDRDPSYQHTFDYLEQRRQMIDSMAVNKHGARVAGGAGGLKVIAQVPLRILQGLLHVEPDLIKQGKRLEKLLERNKAYRAYTEGKKF